MKSIEVGKTSQTDQDKTCLGPSYLCLIVSMALVSCCCVWCSPCNLSSSSLYGRWQAMCSWLWTSLTTCHWRTWGSSEELRCMKTATLWQSSSTTAEMGTLACDSWDWRTSQVCVHGLRWVSCRLSVSVSPLSEALRSLSPSPLFMCSLHLCISLPTNWTLLKVEFCLKNKINHQRSRPAAHILYFQLSLHISVSNCNSQTLSFVLDIVCCGWLQRFVLSLDVWSLTRTVYSTHNHGSIELHTFLLNFIFSETYCTATQPNFSEILTFSDCV